MSSHYRMDVWVGLALAIALDTAVQLSWKFTVSNAPADASPLELVKAVLSQPLFYGTIAMFLMQFFNWMRVLSRGELSFVQPITAMSYVSVSACSVWFLHEHITLLQSIGIALILVGVWFISQTSSMQDQESTMHDQASTMHDQASTMHDQASTMHDQASTMHDQASTSQEES